jgi:hypothetical protein
MTKKELLAIIAHLPDDTVILDGKHQTIHAHSVRTVNIDDWSNSTKVDGGEIPGTVTAITIGSRF